MRIAQIVASLEARHGGPSRSVLELSVGLAGLGHEVELLSTDPHTASIEQPVPGLIVYRFQREWPERLTVSAGLRRHLLTGHYDIIHEHGLWLRPLHYAATAARLRSLPLVISPRGMMSPWSWQHRRWKKILANVWVHPHALQSALGFHATSEEEAADIRSLGFIQPVCVAPNGTKLPDAASVNLARDYWYERCPQLQTRRTALFYSRFHSKKRIRELFEIWATHAPTDWQLLAVGIPEEYTVRELQEHAKRQGASDRIHIFDGTITPAPYAVASVFLLPTHSENFGLTVAEALAHGLPVVTTDTTPWRGLDAHGAGRCVPWTQFHQAMLALLHEDSGSLSARGARARLWMESDFSWARSARTIVDFYDSLSAVRK